MKTINLGKIIPQKYLDYWTPEDIAEIESYINNSVVEALGDYENCLDEIIKIQDTITGDFSRTPTDNRTTLSYWYSYLGDDFVYGYINEETGEEGIIGDPIEELEYPKGTENITSASDFASVFIYDEQHSLMYDIKGLPIKRFTGNLDLPNVVDAEGMFRGIDILESIGDLRLGKRLENTRYMFINCYSLTAIPEIDMRNVTDTSYMLAACRSLTSVRLKNLKTSIQIDVSNLIAVDDYIYMIYHLRNTGSSKTLTMGRTNLAKLANVYVKTIHITDAMRAEDDLIDEKLPFELCQSTDTGAMLITDYATLKNWILK